MTDASTVQPRNRLRGFLLRGLRSVGYGGAVGVVVTLTMERPFDWALIHSCCIGLMCWFFIDVGRVPVARWLQRRGAPPSPEADSDWPGWPAMMVIIAVGSVLGFTTGGTLGEWITGVPSPGYFRGSSRQTMGLLVTSLLPAALITWWFYTREKIAGQAAAVQEAQRQAAETQLKLLESQLEPHMLFNTLANLRALIALDPPRAQQMLDQLIAFLRATLGASRAASHPLSAEFARLRDYLGLMGLRMGERLRSRLELPAALAALPVPPLLLQPLVENSIKHGLEPNVAGGEVVVSAAREDGFLVLRVADTGVGLAEAADPGGTHFGLAQVRERLATLYGPRARFDLTAGAGGGAVATLHLPMDALERAA